MLSAILMSTLLTVLGAVTRDICFRTWKRTKIIHSSGGNNFYSPSLAGTLKK